MQSAFLRRLEQRTSVAKDYVLNEERWSSVDKIIGNTPLVPIQADFGSRIWAKVESENPGESHYDRCYVELLRAMEQLGECKPGGRLLEVTSGNAGVSCGWIARLRGYQTDIVIPPLDPAREHVIRETNDAVIRSQHDGFLSGAVRTFRDVAREARRAGHPYVIPNHSRRPETPRAFERIGAEINTQLPQNIELDAFVCAIGNGTTVTGITRALRERHHKILIHGFEDAGAPCAYQRKYGGSNTPYSGTVRMPGAGGTHDVDMPFVDPDFFNQISLVPEAQWQAVFEEWNTQHPERIDTIGRTSAAALSVARTLIAERRKAMNVLILFYDKADRYGDQVVEREDALYRGNGRWS